MCYIIHTTCVRRPCKFCCLRVLKIILYRILLYYCTVLCYAMTAIRLYWTIWHISTLYYTMLGHATLC